MKILTNVWDEKEFMRNKKADNELKTQNRIRVIKYVLEHKNVSRQDIAAALGFSMPTVFSYVTELLDLNILCETGKFGSTGGRKAKVLSIQTGERYVIGMDITKHHLRLLLMDFAGSPVAEKYFRFPYENTEQYYFDLGAHLEQFINENQLPKEQVIGVGISIPGIINIENKMLQRSHILEVSNISLFQFSKNISYPTYFENDANSAAYAEISNEITKNTIYLSLSNTVGGAICYSGMLYTGDNYKSGEFGHMVIRPGGKTCYCGKQGCLDAYCSAMVLQGKQENHLEDFFDKLLNREEESLKKWDEYLENLAIAVTNLRMAYDCDIILGGYIGGYIAQYRGQFYQKLQYYNKFEQDTSYIIIGKYKRQSTVIGIARMMLNYCIAYEKF